MTWSVATGLGSHGALQDCHCVRGRACAGCAAGSPPDGPPSLTVSHPLCLYFSMPPSPAPSPSRFQLLDTASQAGGGGSSNATRQQREREALAVKLLVQVCVSVSVSMSVSRTW
jgi:hypothetical protein